MGRIFDLLWGVVHSCESEQICVFLWRDAGDIFGHRFFDEPTGIAAAHWVAPGSRYCWQYFNGEIRFFNLLAYEIPTFIFSIAHNKTLLIESKIKRPKGRGI